MVSFCVASHPPWEECSQAAKLGAVSHAHAFFMSPPPRAWPESEDTPSPVCSGETHELLPEERRGDGYKSTKRDQRTHLAEEGNEVAVGRR